MDELKLGRLARDFRGALTRSKRADGQDQISFSLSSEEPVARWYGTEILSHDAGAVRLDRAAGGAMPLLFNHDWGDPIGMVDAARAEGGRLVVDAHFFDTERAREVRAMLDGGLRNVSVGYEIYAVEERVKDNTYTAIDWEPLEASIVTVPADITVGIGRAADAQEHPVRVVRVHQPAAHAAHTEANTMADSTNAAAGAQADQAKPSVAHVSVTDNGPGAGFDAVEREKQRGNAIRTFAKAAAISDEATIRHWIMSGKDYKTIGDEILEIQIARGKAENSAAYLGLTPAETRRFSIIKAVRAIQDNNWTDAGFEAECSRAIAERLGKNLNATSFMVPVDVQQRTTLQVGTAANGGYLVGTDIQPASFVDLLRNRSVVMRLGARELNGLVGAVAIPKQLAAGAAAWIGELGTATANEMTLTQITMSPKTIAGYQEISRQLLLQGTPDAEQLVNADLAAILALGLDTAALAGTSTDSTQPLGIRYQSGLGTANPTSGTAVAYADMIKFQSTVASSNALFDNFAYVCHPAVAAVLMGKPRFTNSDTPIWEGALLDGVMVGKRAMSTLQVTSGTVLGGDFSQVVVGSWGALEIAVNPYAAFQSGKIGVRAMWSVDVAVRYAAAFAIGTGITG